MSASSLLIQHAQVLLSTGEYILGDVEVQAGKIIRVADSLSESIGETTVIDATGLTLLPGVIDPQVHFREPGLEHKEDLCTASYACVRGGVTSFLEMPNTRLLTTTQAALDDKLNRASQKCLANYGFFIGATPENLPDLISANPTPGIKIFMGSMHGDLLVDEESALDPIFANGNQAIA